MTQTPGPLPSDLQLVVYENSPGNPNHGRLSSIDPAQATGIPIPTFRVGANRPAVGTVSGEAFYEATTQRGFIWDGANWRDVTASAIQRYPNDAILVADQTQGVGTFAVSGSTGNIYTYTTSGWQRIGTQEYATVAALLADNPGDGTLALALDEESAWERVSTGWRCTSLRQMADTAAVLAWTDPASSHVGDRALAQDKEVIYIRGSAGWRPSSIYTSTEANIRADVTWPLPGQEAVSTDTGQIFVFANNQWIEDPIQHYPTEADLLAAAPPVGTVAFGDDNGLVYARTSGGWRRVNSPTSSIGPHPATPAAGDLNYRANRGLQVYEGTRWVDAAGSTPIGTVIMHCSETPPTGYLLADGSAVPAGAAYDELRAMVGANLPDLRGQFIRGWGAPTGPSHTAPMRSPHNYTTARPRSTFSGTSSAAGAHTHDIAVGNVGGWTNAATGTPGALESQEKNWVSGPYERRMPGGWILWDAPTHTHTLSITNGGDVETAPNHVILAFHIKAI